MKIPLVHNSYQTPEGKDQVFAQETDLLRCRGRQVRLCQRSGRTNHHRGCRGMIGTAVEAAAENETVLSEGLNKLLPIALKQSSAQALRLRTDHLLQLWGLRWQSNRQRAPADLPTGGDHRQRRWLPGQLA